MAGFSFFWKIICSGSSVIHPVSHSRTVAQSGAWFGLVRSRKAPGKKIPKNDVIVPSKSKSTGDEQNIRAAMSTTSAWKRILATTFWLPSRASPALFEGQRSSAGHLARSFHTTIPDDNLLLPAKSMEEVYLLIKLGDYEDVKGELRLYGYLHEFDTTEETKPVPIKTEGAVCSYRMLKFFIDYEFEPESIKKGPSTIIDLVADKHDVCHGSYSDKEFQQVIDVAKRNESFLQMYGITITYVENIVKTLQRSRHHANNQFVFVC